MVNAARSGDSDNISFQIFDGATIFDIADPITITFNPGAFSCIFD